MSEFTRQYRNAGSALSDVTPVVFHHVALLRDVSADLIDALDARLRVLEARSKEDEKVFDDMCRRLRHPHHERNALMERVAAAERAERAPEEAKKCCAYWKSETRHAEALLTEAMTKLAKLRDVLDE